MLSIQLPHHHDTQNCISEIPDFSQFEKASDILKLLGDPSRSRIFWILCHCEECVSDISAMVQMSSPAVSHHLKLLKTSGLIVSRRAGKEMYYTAADNEQAQLLHHTIEQMIEVTCPKDS